MSDRIVSHPSTDAYRSGYDAIFGKAEQSKEQKPEQYETGEGAAQKSEPK